MAGEEEFANGILEEEFADNGILGEEFTNGIHQEEELADETQEEEEREEEEEEEVNGILEEELTDGIQEEEEEEEEEDVEMGEVTSGGNNNDDGIQEEEEEEVEMEEVTSGGNSNDELSEDEVDSESDQCNYSSSSGDQEFVTLDLEWSDFRNYFGCPICLGICRNTKALVDCLHRFCGECIEKSMREWGRQCPVCFDGNRCSMQNDPNIDSLISALRSGYPSFVDHEE